MANPIYDITPFTMLDYPGKTACIVWFAGCNMRCGYCYNPDIVLGKGKLSYDDLFRFLDKRQGLLDAVVLSGGECTLHKDLEDLCQRLKRQGFLVKIDTNGTRPGLLKQLMDDFLIDYVALDFKATGLKYKNVTALNAFQHFEESLHVLMNGNIPYEVRTTVHSALLCQQDIASMAMYLSEKGYKHPFYIQYALDDVQTLVSLERPERNIRVQEINAPLEIVERN
ncbi:MAG: anaerobic ribonucleoside-triphosphate reductase activating protein [Niabella sp.]